MPEGICEGGPLDGMTFATDATMGFIMVDEHGLQHIYLWDENLVRFGNMMYSASRLASESSTGQFSDPAKWETITQP